MKSKLIFRILGALASALIIVSVLVPFVSVTGYSTSLWETYELANSLYLPIMIMVFGAIGVIFFALNIKTEFAYMSSGATLFFIIIETIDVLNQGAFSSLSVGYYLLVIGSVLTGVMAFLTNLRSKKKQPVVVTETKEEETSMLDQIDKLYNEQTTTQSEISPIQPVDSIVQPLPVQPLEAIAPVQPVEQVVATPTVEEVPMNPVVQEIPTENSEVVQEPVVEQVQTENAQQPVNPVVQEFNVPVVEETVVAQEQPVQSTAETPVNQPVNPVLQEFAQVANPVVQEFNVPSATVVEEPQVVQQQSVNPVLQEFAQPTNPVIQGFGISNAQAVEEQPVVQQPVLNQEVDSVPLTNINNPTPNNPVVEEFNNQGSIITAPQQNSNELDIFGQPINKS